MDSSCEKKKFATLQVAKNSSIACLKSQLSAFIGVSLPANIQVASKGIVLSDASKTAMQALKEQ